MDKVYIVQHEYMLKDDFGEHEEVKLIGVYSTEQKANDAIAKLHKAEGFCDYPLDCFYIDCYIVDETMWKDGFTTVRYTK